MFVVNFESKIIKNHSILPLQRDLRVELMGPSARGRVKLKPEAVPDTNWADPRDNEAGESVSVTDFLKEQSEAKKERISLLKRKRLVREGVKGNSGIIYRIGIIMNASSSIIFKVNQAILENDTRELMQEMNDDPLVSSMVFILFFLLSRVFSFTFSARASYH